MKKDSTNYLIFSIIFLLIQVTFKLIKSDNFLAEIFLSIFKNILNLVLVISSTINIIKTQNIKINSIIDRHANDEIKKYGLDLLGIGTPTVIILLFTGNISFFEYLINYITAFTFFIYARIKYLKRYPNEITG